MRRFAAVAWALVAVAIVSMIGSRVANTAEERVFSAAASPPPYVRLKSGVSYTVSRPTGAPSAYAVSSLGAPASLDCGLIEKTTLRTHPVHLVASAAGTSIYGVGTFVSPVSGQVKVICSGLGPIWIDDAEEVPFDYAGALVLLTVVSGFAAASVLLVLGYRRRS
jgi:D-serine deaminase-like pyridoxal phosphate-dependent protein